MKKVLLVFGTRPEAIKLCPVVTSLRKYPDRFVVRVCVTGQHRQMLDQVLSAFDVQPDFDLDLMTAGQTLSQSTSRILAGLEPVLHAEKPDMVLVQGDTTSTFCGALAAFYQQIPVGHVEAGLRTGDLMQPFPEELNRVFTTKLASLHFAPTEMAADNLRRESVRESSISVTGNTGIDALLQVRDGLESGRIPAPSLPALDASKKLVLVTAHRRESFGEGIANLCSALKVLARRSDVQIVYPVHPNPNVAAPVRAALGSIDNVVLLDPLDYIPFVDLMRHATILLTDSGGVQEEGPALGKPVLVLREKTERPEGLATGTVYLVGTDGNRILSEAAKLLDSAASSSGMQTSHLPYGDGRASERISNLIHSF
jgi:UDP-N-acetylglucosamine 2-epimerase (non-hydrolysing)